MTIHQRNIRHEIGHLNLFLQGQWRNDLFNGQGMMSHASGMTYEGLWINNKPAVLATKIVIISSAVHDNILEMPRGDTFALEVETRNEEDEHIEGSMLTFLLAGYCQLP